MNTTPTPIQAWFARPANPPTTLEKVDLGPLAAEDVIQSLHSRRVQYAARIHATGGRDGGLARSSDGRLEVKFSLPGSVGPGTNPEQLLAAGWSNCFLSAVKQEAHRLDVGLPFGVAIDAEVDLCLIDGDIHSLQARLDVSLPGVDRDVAQAIVNLARHTCPFSKALRRTIGVTICLV